MKKTRRRKAHLTKARSRPGTSTRASTTIAAVHGMALLGACLATAPATAQAQVLALPPVEIVSPSPLPGQGVDRNQLPYATQVMRRSAVQQAQPDNLPELMLRRLAGVQGNEIQGSPYQMDLTFRGYRASGLIGAAQGLSVYVDGVRVNEPFGDVVSWDLLPEFALDSVALVPGANPTFGLNTLGGALALSSTDGRRSPGIRAEVSAGSFGRKRLDASFGHANERFDHYLAVSGFDESGWRDFSPGKTQQVFGKFGANIGADRFTLTAQVARSTLVGNGLVPEATLDDDGSRTPDLLATSRRAVYTHPDRTRNTLDQFNLQWRRELSAAMSAEALVYVRQSRRSTVNGDVAEELGDDADDPTAALNRTVTKQRATGFSAALSGQGGGHRWQLGASLERSRVDFEQTEQEGDFDNSRGVRPRADEPQELAARVLGSSRHLGVYLTDTWMLQPGLFVTASLRHNRSTVSNRLTTVDDEDDEVEERAEERLSYRSTNPALGVTWQATPGVALFANAARNTRVPTVIELGCADPDEPCRLPAGLQSDPFLKQVVARSIELGTRFTPMPGARASLSLYRTDNRDDILFRSVSATSQRGYFQNFERTRHEGLDAEIQARTGALEWSGSYSFLRATYQAEGLLRFGERNVAIDKGTPIAGLPRHLLKASVDWRAGAGWSLGLDVTAVASRGVSGNEDGLIEDGEDERVVLRLPRYAVATLRARYAPAACKGLEFFGRVNNLFDRRHASFGALGETRFDAQGGLATEERPALFVAPGAPRSFMLGLRIAFD
jgi:outer membrane receptor protein involved in Fe transport